MMEEDLVIKPVEEKNVNAEAGPEIPAVLTEAPSEAEEPQKEAQEQAEAKENKKKHPGRWLIFLIPLTLALFGALALAVFYALTEL